MNAQQIIAANVAARGYRDGWTTDQFVARQLCKLTEELGEAVHKIIFPIGEWTDDHWTVLVADAALQAKDAFGDKRAWMFVGFNVSYIGWSTVASPSGADFAPKYL